MAINITLREAELRRLQRELFDDSPVWAVLEQAVLDTWEDGRRIAHIRCSPGQAEGLLAAAECYCRDVVPAIRQALRERDLV
jgi:hypothetical protein